MPEFFALKTPSLRRPLNRFAFGLACAGFGGIAWASAASASPYDKIYAFGDSLSDVGNVYTIAPTFGLPEQPTAPYVGGQFSNGPVWVQDLAVSLGLPALTPSLLGGTDYAYGSAQTGTTLFNAAGAADLLGPTGQIVQYQTTSPAADPNALYTIWIGSNDLSAISPGASAQDIAADLAAIIDNIDTAITQLAVMGAKNFLIVDAPDLGNTPDGQALGPIGAGELSQLAYEFDLALFNGDPTLGIASLASIKTSLGLNLDTLDTYGLLDSAIADPGQYGLTNATDPCLTGEVNYGGGTVCSTPGSYLFWDGEHPTATGHALIAEAAALAVPEPAPLSLVVAGLTAIAMIRRRGKPVR